MATQLESFIYIRSHDSLEEVARLVFDSLGGDYSSDQDPALGGDYCRLSALGLEATVFSNVGEMEDEDFSDYGYGLGIVSTHLDPDLEMAPAEAPLAEYFARLLAFNLDVEVATSFYLGAQDGVDLYEIRAFRRNPQYTLDAGPTAQKVYVAERRTVEYDVESIAGDLVEDGSLDEEA